MKIEGKFISNHTNIGFIKQHTQIAKGFAILLMVIHHLFGVANNMPHSTTIMPQIGSFGKICVAMYAFMSGYGLFLSFKSKGTINPIKRSIKLYLRYWISLLIIIIFTAIFSFDKLKIGSIKLILNFLAVYLTLDPNVWFLLPYLVFIFALPLFCHLISKIKKTSIQFVAELFLLFIIPIIISIFLDSINFSNMSGLVSYFVGTTLHLIILLIPFFSIGYIFAKYNLFKYIDKLHINNIIMFIIFVLSIAFCYILRLYFNPYVSMGMTITDIFIAPIMVFATSNLITIINIKPLNYVFEKLGFLSCNIWFIHALFCQGALMWLTFAPKYDWLIALFGIVLSTITAILIEFIYNLLIQLYKKFLKKLVKKIKPTKEPTKNNAKSP